MNKHVIGTCSICGGAVVVPLVWMCVIPPVPRCESCGAVEAVNNGPVINMKRGPGAVRHFTTDGTTLGCGGNR